MQTLPKSSRGTREGERIIHKARTEQGARRFAKLDSSATAPSKEIARGIELSQVGAAVPKAGHRVRQLIRAQWRGAFALVLQEGPGRDW